jgi:hypothetical protein
MVSRPRIILGLLVVCILSLPFFYVGYVSNTENSSERIIYQTPVGGMALECGQWLYHEEVLPRPPMGFDTMYSYELEIHEWNVPLDEMIFSHSMRHYTLDEFLGMNDTQKLAAGFGGSGTGIEETRSVYGDGRWGISGEWGTHVWAARFVDREFNVISGSFRISLTVTIVTFEKTTLFAVL